MAALERQHVNPQIRRYFSDFSICCPHQMYARHWFGIASWELDPTNVGIAREAFATIDLKNEPSLDGLSVTPFLWLSNLPYLCGDRWSLDANQLALTRELGIIDKLPRITEDEINDLNKGDIVVKFLAVSQISWLCIQLVTRLSRKIPTTQLELLTLAFAICSIITYGFYYNRPKDVQTVREVLAVRDPTPAELARIANVGPACWIVSRQNASVPNNAMHGMNRPYFLLCSMLGLIVFGSLHLLAWNSEFPSQVERRLWQASALVTIAVMPSANLFVNIIARLPMLTRISWTGVQVTIIISVHIFAFVAARAFILVEVVRSLAYQPPETFRTTWAANVPHVG
jgi:hypothetical protein